MIDATIGGQVAAQNQGVWFMNATPAPFAADWAAAFSASTVREGTKLHESICFGPFERHRVGLAVSAGWGKPPSRTALEVFGNVAKNFTVSFLPSLAEAKWGGLASSSS